MLKKGLLVFSIFSQVFLVGLLSYLIYFNQSEPEIVSDIFVTDNFEEKLIVRNKGFIPYKQYIEIDGYVVPEYGYLELKSPVHGMVKNVFVSIGDVVKKGDPLFKMDDRKIQIQLKTEEAKLQKAIAQLNFHKKPCKYALIKKLKEIDDIYLEKKKEEKLYFAFNHLLPKLAVSRLEKQEQQIQLAMTCNKLDKKIAEYKQIEQGISKEKEKILKSEIEIKKTAVKAKMLKLQNTILQSPGCGTIIDVKIKKGEFTYPQDEKVIIFAKGDQKKMQVMINELDVSKIDLNKNLRGYAVHKKNPQWKFPLKFLYFHPKIDVNKDGQRNMQVYFSFKNPPFPIYFEQSFLVYIETFDYDL